MHSLPAQFEQTQIVIPLLPIYFLTRTQPSTRSFATGQATSFDAELVGLMAALSPRLAGGAR